LATAAEAKVSMQQIIDHETMKLGNQLLILRTIRATGPVSRVKLQKKTALSWGTITSSIKELLHKQIVREIGAVNTGVGRRPVELDMNTERNHIVGLRLGSTKIRAVLLDVKGSVVRESKEFVDAEANKDIILDQLITAAEKLLQSEGLNIVDIAGIGIAAPGALDAHSGVCLYAPHHPKWKNVALKRIFEERFNIPCFVDHVNNCSALGEMWFGGGKGIDNFLCVLLGTGISTGIIINGEVYRGVNCASGEFGHTCVVPRGPECACGRKGCLETYASGPALAHMAIEIAQNRKGSIFNSLIEGKLETITAETVFQAANRGDADALRIFEKMGFYLGIGISNLINLFNPERIILSGQVAQAGKFFIPSLEHTIKEHAWHISQKSIEISNLENGAVLGAAGVVLQEIYNNKLLFTKFYTKKATA
jgi:glucokinase-like ROK family protein